MEQVIGGEQTLPGRYLKSAHEHNLQVLWDRIPLWKKLHHKNIITFHGADVTAPEWPSLVYDWAEKGNIIEYIALNPKAHKLRLVCESPPL